MSEIHLAEESASTENYAMRGACSNGHLEISQWLLSIKPDMDIHAENICIYVSYYKSEGTYHKKN